MADGILIEEFHLTVRAPRRLPDRRAFRAFPPLTKVRVKVSR
jgi:hypothetical protein